MDSGRFESVSRPYSFHQVMRGLFVPLRLATDARQLDLETDLDPCIDKVRLSHLYVSLPPSGRLDSSV
jgi:osomolarity two-component system, sensor histidine kinase SLN1